MKKKSWKRMTMALLGVVVIALVWRWSVYHLYHLPEHSIAAFTSLTTNSFYVIGAIVWFMITGQTVYEWKNSSATSVVQQTQQIIERRLKPKDVDDGTVA